VQELVDERCEQVVLRLSAATGNARSPAPVRAIVGVPRDNQYMEVTARAIENVPRGNLYVSRDEFVALWRRAEQVGEESPADWYVAGVRATCRWLACAAVPSILGGWQLAWAPVTERSGMAHEELIEAERLAAEVQLLRHPGGLDGRPGWLEGIVATLQWAWAGSAAAPLEMPSTNAG
jgi:hypothetical protein